MKKLGLLALLLCVGLFLGCPQQAAKPKAKPGAEAQPGGGGTTTTAPAAEEKTPGGAAMPGAEEKKEAARAARPKRLRRAGKRRRRPLHRPLPNASAPVG